MHLKAIAEEAIKEKLVLEDLRAIIEDTMKEVMFDIPSDEEYN